MSPAVRAALIAFQEDYLGATAPPNSRGYSVHGVCDRADACLRHERALPRTIEFARLRAFIRHVERLEEMAGYEWDVTRERGRRWAEREGREV